MDEEKKEVVEKVEKKYDGREIYYILGGMAFLVFLLYGMYAYGQSQKVFEYNGLIFTKEKIGEIETYKYSYFPENPTITGSAINENPATVFYFRMDPRENNVSISVEDIIFRKGESVYITYKGKELEGCPYGLLATSNMAGILARGGVRMKSGLGDKEIAIANNITYVTCEEFPDNMVIQVESSDVTEVVQEGKCYRIKVNNCEILPATEKFVVEALLRAVQKRNSEN